MQSKALLQTRSGILVYILLFSLVNSPLAFRPPNLLFVRLTMHVKGYLIKFEPNITKLLSESPPESARARPDDVLLLVISVIEVFVQRVNSFFTEVKQLQLLLIKRFRRGHFCTITFPCQTPCNFYIRVISSILHNGRFSAHGACCRFHRSRGCRSTISSTALPIFRSRLTFPLTSLSRRVMMPTLFDIN